MRYRKDIDGLRAVAVLSVLAFHLESGLLPGGFVGVDIFFVISGYLIGRIIVDETDAGAFSFVGFYERRVRRILPALLTMIAIVGLAAVALLPPTHLIKYVNSAAAAAFSLSNVYFQRHSGYFDLGAHELPLLHTWSLAVEEQFYLLFPALFLIGRRGLRARWVSIIAPLLAASFAISLAQTQQAPSAAFYLPFSRCWEFLIGAVLIAVSLAAFNQATPFPGWAAAIPCLGAALILHAGEGASTLVGRLLALRPIVGVGLISYSLYLWHWPVFVFARLLWGGSFSADQALILLAAVFGLAWLSWRYIEQPVRRNRAIFTRRRLFVGTAAALAAFAGARVAINELAGLPSRFGPEATRLLTDDRWVGGQVADDGTAFIGDPRAPVSFAMVGDSFGGALAPGLDAEARRQGRRGVMFIKPGCYPLLDAQSDQAACTRFVRDAVARIEAMPNVTAVVLIGRWTAAVEGQRLGSQNMSMPFLRDARTRQPGPQENAAVFARSLERTLAGLPGRRVYLVAHIPEQRVNVMVAAAIRAHLGWDPRIAVQRSDFEAREARTRQLVAKLARDGGFSVLDASRLLCDQRQCAATADGRALYFDDNHLSIHGAELVARRSLYAPVFGSYAPR